MEFKVGDKVRVLSYCSSAQQGEIYTLGDDGDLFTILPDGNPGCRCKSNWELVVNNKNMNLIEKAVLAVTPEPQKSFRKAGITNGDGILTDEGMKVFLSFLLSKNQDEFKTAIVDPILAEKE